MDEKGIVATFAACSRLLNRIALKAGDRFFSELYAKEADKLLAAFVKFLKTRGDTRNAQPGRELVFRIKNILSLSEVLQYLRIIEPTTPLLLEKNLLTLESAVLDLGRAQTAPFAKASGFPVKVQKPKKKTVSSQNGLGETHHRIAEFVKSRGKVQNLEVFSEFSEISKRTLKRKLSELRKAGDITRSTEGKRVFYVAVLKP